MCGIVGYVGNDNCRDIIIDGLKKLEYRGYDSAGIALIDKGIVENYVELKEWLMAEHGIHFKTETDSEVIAQLIGVLNKGCLEDAVLAAVDKMKGA